MAIDVAVQTGDAETRLNGLTIVGGIELFLRKWGYQKLQTVELNGVKMSLNK
jgi:hypothetical protein